MKAIHDTRVIGVLAVWLILLPIIAFLPVDIRWTIESRVVQMAFGYYPHSFDDWYHVFMLIIVLISILVLAW